MTAITFSKNCVGDMNGLFALHRHGGLDVILGREIVCEETDHNAFKLTHIFHRIWSALTFYAEVVDRYGLEGPFEISNALHDTHGTILSDLASGWSESDSEKRKECKDRGVFLRREVFEWPDESGAQDLAVEIASWIEDSWGYRDRRFLPREGSG